ncbi:MAG TPA: hypothetical protein PK052_11740 [Anaerohalosphaeraceae bacterium]|nr:hypothetical protein [Phycisphaerae bacterium]HOL32639.1 hypothetical protein [Anaerohalosphaeraceae bacterium]HPO70920.1 hypothetical protein [Anaerohalosphaeraceae bacterium]
MDQGWGDPQPAALRLHNNAYQNLNLKNTDPLGILVGLQHNQIPKGSYEIETV